MSFKNFSVAQDAQNKDTVGPKPQQAVAPKPEAKPEKTAAAAPKPKV
jgi:hypothetical protein